MLFYIFGGVAFAGQVITVDDDGPANYSRIQDAIDGKFTLFPGEIT